MEGGRNPDFIAQLDAAIAEVERVHLDRARVLGSQVGSAVGIVMDTRRARQLLTLLECQIVTGFAEDGAKLAEWRSAKRVRAKSCVPREEVQVAAVEAGEAALQLVTAA